MHVLSERQLRNGLAGLVTGGAIVAWCCTDLFGHELLASIAILALFAMSLDLLAGYSGQVSLGHAAFYGIGAYGTAALSAILGWPMWLAVPLSILLTAVLAFGVALFVVRLTGVFFLMITLAIGEMFYSFFFRTRFFGGDDGLGGIPRPDFSWIGIDLSNPAAFSMFAILIAVLVYCLLARLSDSVLGAVISGVRQNEARMGAIGCPVISYKVAVFTLAGGIAALAGSLSAQHDGFVSPDLLSWTVSGEVLIVVIIGGLSSLVGPVIGAAVMVMLAHYISGVTNYWMFFMGLFFVAVVLAGGRGIYGLYERACGLVCYVKRT